MSHIMVMLWGLIVGAVFIASFVWILRRENRRLQTLVDQAEYVRMACENASDGLTIQDMKGRIVWCNPAYCLLHRRTSANILGRNPLSFALPPDKALTAEEIEAVGFNISEDKLQLCRDQNGDGELFWNQISVSFRRLADGREYAVTVCRDVTEQVEHQNEMHEISVRLEHEATHDGLTGVPNRAAFMSFAEGALQAKDRAPIGLLHVDLDKFKVINDTHGHSAGDAVLVHSANALRDHIRSRDMIARVGGDEFVIVCLGLTSLADLDFLAKNLIDAISEPFEWSNRLLQIEASIGAALSSTPNITAEDLLVQADFALYEAKRAGRNNVVLYDDALHDQHSDLIRRSGELIDAVDTNALDYFFQPILDLATGTVIGFETLVRWNHRHDGIIPPDEFLPLAKDLGLMGALDLLSMSAALIEKRRLMLAGHPDITIAFNASPELLTHPEFVNRLVWGVEAGGIDRAHVIIEVLETTEFGDAAQIASHAAILRDLRHAGFQVHLDDFGVGFAGLSHLATLDVTGVKIDRGLIKGILSDETSRKIVRKIVELSNDLGLFVIAEGVEDQATADALLEMGCKVIQGYWLSRPLPSEALLDWLAAHIQLDTALQA